MSYDNTGANPKNMLGWDGGWGVLEVLYSSVCVC